jgi:AsmA protein
MAPPPRRRRWPVVVGVVALLLVAVVVVAVLALDAVLLSKAREQAAALSRDLGRPVAIGGLRTKLLGGLGVRVSDVEIGAGPDEGLPLLALPRAEVEADLWRAIRTGGKEVHVREAVLEGLRLNVVRLADGTTNLQRLSDALARRAPGERKPAEPAAPKEDQPADLSAVQVRRAAVEDARIAFLDRATPGAREVAIDDLDIEVKDLAAGRPLEVLLRAAVLAQKQNLEIRLSAAPLPPSLVPTPTRLVVKAEPIDLAPLAPFFPPSAGFRGGRFQADLEAALGAAVPGGSGPTRVRGGLRATALRFEGQEGGKPLDVVVATDLDGDVAAGDLRISSLQIQAGPARLTGQGRVAGFTGSSPSVEGLEIVGTGLDPDALAAYYPPLRKQVAGRVSGPLGFTVRGAGGADAQTLELRVDLGPVRLAIPDAAVKAPGAPLLLVARARTSGGAAVSFDASVDASGVDLRPGGSAKKPGDPLSAKATGSWRRAGAEQHLEVSRLDLDLLGDRLAGKARAVLGGTKERPTTRFDAELEGQRLDVDRLLLPARKDGARKEAAPPAPASKDAFAGLSGEARVKLGALRAKGVEARNVLARVRVQGGELTVDEGKLDVLGGTVSAAGTKLNLADKDAPFRVVAELKGIAAEQGLGMMWASKIVSGTVDGKLDLAGKGFEPGQLAKAATGALQGALRGGTFHGADLLASVAGPLAQKLPFGGNKIGEGGITKLGKELAFAFQLGDGVARLAKPLQVSRPEGDLALQGGVRLDGTLDMPATLQLTPDLVARITGGRVRPAAPIPVGFRLTGPAWKPAVADLALEPVVQAIVKEAAAGALGGTAAGKAVGAIAGGPAQAEAEAKKKVEEERRAAEQRAQAEADKARQRVEEEARKKLKGLFGQ